MTAPEVSHLRRHQRFLIRWRWIMAIAAVLVLALMVGSRWAMGACFVHLESCKRHVGVSVWAGSINGLQYSDRTNMNTFQFRITDTGPWPWLPSMESKRAQDYRRISLPMWMLLLPLTVLAVAGFRAKRRLPQAGHCAVCRYTLAGAVVCPECGHSHAPLR